MTAVRKKEEVTAVFLAHTEAGMLSGDLLGRSISPQSPLLAGELPLLAPNAYAPSPRKEGEEESARRKTPDHTVM